MSNNAVTNMGLIGKIIISVKGKAIFAFLVLIILTNVYKIIYAIAKKRLSKEFKKFRNYYPDTNLKVNSILRKLLGHINQENITVIVFDDFLEQRQTEYDYLANKFYLSKAHIDAPNLDSICRISHEVGHIIQYKEDKEFLYLNFYAGIIQKFGLIMLPLLIFFNFMFPFKLNFKFITLYTIAIGAFIGAIWTLIMMFPFEKEASKYGYDMLVNHDIITEEEKIIAQKVFLFISYENMLNKLNIFGEKNPAYERIF